MFRQPSLWSRSRTNRTSSTPRTTTLRLAICSGSSANASRTSSARSARRRAANGHVVDGADKIKVRFKDGSEYDGEVRGVDAQSDVAVVKIDPKGKKLKVARLGDSDNTRVGEFAIAIGAPFELDYSVTFGHVSAKGRSRIIPDEKADQDFIQTDANINPGNSGGPLVNIDGEVIGINTLIRGLHTGIGFAIPANLAKEISDKLITAG